MGLGFTGRGHFDGHHAANRFVLNH
jgi:hypothetical protein